MLGRYARWLHTGVPAGRVERLPLVGEDGLTNVPGLRVAGDLTGVPLLKIALRSAVLAVRAFARELEAEPERDASTLDLVIVGGGVAGIAAAIEARALGLRFEVLESTRPFDTVRSFPARKPIYTYPTDLRPEGAMQVAAETKESLLEELEAQRAAHGVEVRLADVERVARDGSSLCVRVAGGQDVRARRVLVAIGRSGDHRRLGVPGEDLAKVRDRLFDPADHVRERVLVVGGGDSACEAAIAIAREGGTPALAHRGEDLARAKPESAAEVERLAAAGRIELLLRTRVRAIAEATVDLDVAGEPRTLENDTVLALIGREPPLAFLRRSGIAIAGDWSVSRVAAMVAFVAACAFVYLWKAGGDLTHAFEARGWFPFGIPGAIGAGAGTALATVATSLSEPGFWYSLAYTLAVCLFGAARIRRRRTAYVTRQTITLAAIQVVPLFLLPYFVLPLLGQAGAFDDGVGRSIADALFPSVSYGHGREYWRAFGLVLAWPLFVWNVFTEQPNVAWLAISIVQTFVIVPLIVRRWGKGAYCGWICSCGALAETMGDAHREKMPHGPAWNRLNLLGQGILAVALALLGARIVSWIWPGGRAASFFHAALSDFSLLGVRLDYYHVVDLTLAGILGVGLYFWASGRTWCRFACPLAALMHVYQRAFGLFRIFADKKKCISCNRCTTVCHQGIDVMAYAQRGLPMDDPQCVRCSACVQTCPTGVLELGRLAPGGPILDAVAASPVISREGRTKLRVVT
jgi:thioredoxin reductase/ferredoxin